MVSPHYIESSSGYRNDTDDIAVGFSEEVVTSRAEDIELEFGDAFDSKTAIIAYSALVLGVAGMIAFRRLRRH